MPQARPLQTGRARQAPLATPPVLRSRRSQARPVRRAAGTPPGPQCLGTTAAAIVTTLSARQPRTHGAQGDEARDGPGPPPSPRGAPYPPSSPPVAERGRHLGAWQKVAPGGASLWLPESRPPGAALTAPRARRRAANRTGPRRAAQAAATCRAQRDVLLCPTAAGGARGTPRSCVGCGARACRSRALNSNRGSACTVC